MQQDSLECILKSIERPAGIMEIYQGYEIGEQPNSHLPLLETCTDFAKGYNAYGLAFKYNIRNDDIHLGLILTCQGSGYPFLQGGEDRFRTVARIEVLGELEFFSYGAAELLRIGTGIKAGHTVGPLEHPVLQEALRKDPHNEQTRQKIGSCLYALGEFAEQLYRLRKISLD